MIKRKYLFKFLIISVLFLFIAGCNKEKAEAIKVAAEKFRIESVKSLEMISDLFTKSLTMPSEGEDAKIREIVNMIDGEPAIDASMLSFVVEEDEIGKSAVDKVKKKFNEIGNVYYQFEGMFRSLPEGSFFARGAVKNAEKHSINLTMQLINFAETLEKHPVQFTGRRAFIVERITEAKKYNDDNLRKEHLTIISKNILQLRNDENKANDEAVIQCLKAAETGKQISDLIRNYESMSASDILLSVRNIFTFVTEISGKNQEMTSLLERYRSVETAIRKDPYWSALLDERIIE
jgi:hypothetical protein